jgi:uncharacterized membrane protein HdeD (DUF308 family)
MLSKDRNVFYCLGLFLLSAGSFCLFFAPEDIQIVIEGVLLIAIGFAYIIEGRRSKQKMKKLASLGDSSPFSLGR